MVAEWMRHRNEAPRLAFLGNEKKEFLRIEFVAARIRYLAEEAEYFEQARMTTETLETLAGKK